ncbi:hypothetical protein OC834_001411 [Tilletia horrida]|nr:hypothetical protein OC834_001411 [Tilletia horrida]
MASTTTTPAAAAAAAGAGAGSLMLNPAERTAFGHLFSLACPPDSGGILTADSAVAFFGKSGLPAATLGAIWALADDKNNGFLDAKGFSLACRLIGHAQAGSPVDFRAASTPGPLPTMEGITIPGLPAGSTSAPAPSAAVDATPVTIKPADRSRYTRIFANAGPVNGMLDSDKAKDLFVKSNLPVDKLAAIWGLADTHQRGALDLADFIIAMHFIQNTMNGTLQSIPATLPPGLYESASVGAPKPVGGAQPGSPLKAIRQQSTGGSFSGSVPAAPLRHQTTGSGAGPLAGTPTQAAIPRQLTGQFQSPAQGSRVGSPVPSAIRSPGVAAAASPFGLPTSPAAAPGLPTAASVIAAGSQVSPAWAVPAATIQRAATFFTQLDTSNSGLLSGASVVPFFMQSQLPEASLAQVWDLADVHQRGSLGLEEFSLAMHLIGELMAGKPLPVVGPNQGLPRELLPPSARGAELPAPVDQNESDTQKDLFSLMDDDDDTTSGALKAAAALPPALKNATASTFVNPAASPTPAAASRQATGQGNFGAFDDDFFNNPMPGSAPAPAPAGGSIIKSVRIADKPPSIIASPDTVASSLPPVSPPPGGQASVPPTSLAAVQQEALRKDIDTETARKAASSAEAAALESSIETDSATLNELETRLKTARAASDAEQARVVGLRERAATQSGELASLRAELISVESNLSALKMERDEVEQGLMKEREDVREARKRMEGLRQEVEAIKVELEQAKKELRKEKGLGAITRKQLSSASADKEKAEAELAAVRSGELAGEEDEAHGADVPIAAAVASSPQAPVDRSAALSPTGSVRSNNPFDRLTVASSAPAAATDATDASQPIHSPSGGAAGTAAAVGLAAGAGAALAIDHVAAGHHDSHDGTEQAAELSQSMEQPEAEFKAADPASSETAATPAPPNTSTTDAFSSAFDDDFGADTTAEPAAPTHVATASNTAFDDAFSGFDELAPAAPVAVAAPEISTIEDSRTDSTQATVAQPEESVDRPPFEDDEDDSSDEDDEGPEDLDQPGAGRRATEPSTGTPFDSQPPVITTEKEEDEAEPAALTAPSASGPSSSLDAPVRQLTSQTTGSETFHDAMTASPLSGAQSPIEQLPVPAAATPTPASAATTEASAPKPARRAPPPAPTKSGSISTPTAAASTEADAAPAAGSSAFDDFEAAFEDLGPATTQPANSGVAAGTSSLTASSTTADFDDAFDNDFDFVPSFTGTGTATGVPATSSASAAFDDAFGGSLSSSTTSAAPNAAGVAAPSSSSAPLTDFNAAFADFDASFGSPKPADATISRSGLGGSGSGSGTGTNVSAPSSGFSFEDAFEPVGDSVSSVPPPLPPASNRPATTTTVVSNPAPALPPRADSSTLAPPTVPGGDGGAEPVPSPALPDDAPPVQQLCAMGFPRQKVIAALEKSNYRVEKALQRLLAS